MARTKKSQHSPVILNDLCRNIRAKGMYTGGYTATDPHALPMNTTTWWCRVTQTEVGPDHYPCLGKDCVSGRGCYEPEREPVA